MDGFIQFLIDNYQWLISLLCALITMVICLFKKKFKVIVPDYISKTLILLPGWISEAECLSKSGKDKFAFVMSKAINKLVVDSGLSVDDITNKYGSMLDAAIENILSTPTKKGE